MKIAIGGLKKEEMKAAVLATNPDIEVFITNDMQAIPMLKNKKVDYYLGACESGGGAAISILIGAIGYTNCATICKNGENPKREKIQKIVNEGKVVFGMAHDKIHLAAPILIELLHEKEIGGQ